MNNEPFDGTQDALAEIPIKLAQLRQAEEMAIEGAAQWIAGQTNVAIALHKIVTQKLYLEERDSDGISQYPSFEDYWKLSLEAKMGVSRSQAFNCLRDIRIALGPSFKLDYETFTRLGGTSRFSAIPEIAEYNQKTGEILGLREGYEVPEGGSVSTFILEHMARHAPGDVDELNLNMSQYKDTLKKALKIGRTVEIEWYLKEVNTPEGLRRKTKYERRVMERNEEGYEVVEQSEGYIDDPDVPADIMEVYQRRLPIVGIYKFQG